MKKKVLNSFIIILIAGLSVICGFIYDSAANAYLIDKYPREYNADVVEYSYEFGVPVSVIYASVKVRSDFQPSLVSDDDRIGLMQLTAEQYENLGSRLGSISDAGLLYEPATNLRLGTSWIALLYDKYENWPCTFAAMKCGEATVDVWLSDISLNDGNGGLIEIPDDEVAEYVELMQKTVEMYKDLYE